jgi:hypothetical protein
MDHPTFCRVEYWSDVRQDWYTGHAGINLMNPAAYALKLGKNGCLARIVCVDTGEVAYSEGADLL